LAQFNAPAGITVDASGQIYVSDSQNGAIRLLTQAGLVTTLAGNGTQGDADGVGSGARFSNPTALIVDPQYLLYVADSGNHKVKTVQIVGGVGTVQTLAGTGHPGDADGESLSIGLRQPLGLTMTVGGELVVSEAAGNRLRLLSRAVLR
jgi:sugar lactone lactonase YvrE